MKKIRLMATTAFGVEGITKYEIKKLGFENIEVENGKVFFDSDLEGLVKSNIWLRTGSKIYWVIDRFKSYSFETLYDRIYNIDWEKILNKNASIIVNAKSVKSKLYSLSSIQSISKKAIVDRLMNSLSVNKLEEDGEKYDILIDILKDKVTVRINTSGDGLFQRGYRLDKNDAPLRETLASTLIQVARWKGRIPLIDPMCGTGTLLIEAAMYGKNMPPNINREFDFEKWPFIKKELIENVKSEALTKISDREILIKGFDIDEEVVEIAKENAKRAGVLKFIDFETKDLKDLETDLDYGYIITNPPYGERIGTYEQVRHINKMLGKKFNELETWSMYVLTAAENFEMDFGKESDKNRKLYNGKIKCYYYQYYGTKPPKKNRL